MSEIKTRIRIGTVKHDAMKITDDEYRILQRNVLGIATHVARRLRPEWPIDVIPVDLPVWISVGAGTFEWEEGRDFITRVVDAIAIAEPYDDTLKEGFQPELFAECYLEDPKRAVDLYVKRRENTEDRSEKTL